MYSDLAKTSGLESKSAAYKYGLTLQTCSLIAQTSVKRHGLNEGFSLA